MSQRSGQIGGGAGMSIASRFGLIVALTLLVVMSAAGYLLLDKSRQALTQAGEQTLSDVAALNAAEAAAKQETVEAILAESKEGRMGLDEAIERLANLPAETYEDQGKSTKHGDTGFHHIAYTKGPGKGGEGYLLFKGEEAGILGTIIIIM